MRPCLTIFLRSMLIEPRERPAFCDSSRCETALFASISLRSMYSLSVVGSCIVSLVKSCRYAPSKVHSGTMQEPALVLDWVALVVWDAWVYCCCPSHQ